MNEQNLSRFLTAHEKDCARALAEIKSGLKRTHWMWYIFPQLARPGLSETSTFYAIKTRVEAEAYLGDQVLGTHLIEISSALLELKNDDAFSILGSPDDMKLKSSMTLFAALPGADAVFAQVLTKFFNGAHDNETITLLNSNV